jgi:hypothetical protein
MSRSRLFLFAALAAISASAASAAVRIDGQVQAGGATVANSTVTLWEASAGEPRRLAQARTDGGGRFEIGDSRSKRKLLFGRQGRSSGGQSDLPLGTG